jgi:hypothetical protein
MCVHEIKDGNETLARHITADTAEPSGLTFYSQPSEYLQVGVWNYAAGVQLPPHIHKRWPRAAVRTQELILVRRGRVRATIYNQQARVVAHVELHSGDLLILLAGGHGYEILEDGTQVLEVKNGPYPGPERDRTRMRV